MPIEIRQVAGKVAAHPPGEYHNTRIKAIFTQPTLPKSCIVAIGAITRYDYSSVQVTKPSGFVTAFLNTDDDVELHFWYKEGADPLNEVEMYVGSDGRAAQIMCFELTGVAQSSALDKVNSRSGNDTEDFNTGTTGTITTIGSIVIAAAMNQHPSSSQTGFTGGFSRITETVTPSSDYDSDRNRLTTHALVASSLTSFVLSGRLSSARDWASGIVVFKPGTSGPARFTSKNSTGCTVGTRGNLSVFGPLKSTQAGTALTVTNTVARMGPFNYQYRLRGWDGLLIGSGTKFHVEGTEGLNGWQIRTSDDDLPRGDGALRGIDLESARQILFKMNVGKGRDEVEANMRILFNALVPQRDEDWEMIWRHPGSPLKMIRVRPIDILRERSARQLFVAKQQFVLRAADPRHYSAIPKTVQIPVSPSENAPVYVSVVNEGNAAAYPFITIKGPSSGQINRIELVNLNGLYTFDVRLTLPSGSELKGDMEARVTGTPRSIITLDGASKYGAWQLPRLPFRLEPDPVLPGGDNMLYLRTEPAGADVQCTLTYRDTWSG